MTTPNQKTGHTPTPWRMKSADGSDFYNEYGPTYYVFPIERTDELGVREQYLVANVDGFDENNYTGDWIAECNTKEEARRLVIVLNSHDALVYAVQRAQKLIDHIERSPALLPIFQVSCNEGTGLFNEARAALKLSQE